MMGRFEYYNIRKEIIMKIEYKSMFIGLALGVVGLFSVLLLLGNIETEFSFTAGAPLKIVKDGTVYEAQKTLLGKFVNAFLERNAKGCADLYAKNAIYMIPETQALEGYNAILDSYNELFSYSLVSEMKMVEPVVEVLEMGDWAVVRGTGSSTEIIKGDLQTKTYKWVILSQKQDDETWKMVWDIFNYDAPYENI